MAWSIYENIKGGIASTYKTTRAGATTALIAESMNRKEKFLAVVPTNAIADDTIIKEARKYSDNPDGVIIHIPSNHRCLLNEEKCHQWPELAQLPILPLAEKCADCEHYYSCPVTQILHCNDYRGIVITYQKLVALQLAAHSRPNTTAERILNKIMGVKNIIFDEVHEIQYGRGAGMVVYNDAAADGAKWVNLTNYLRITQDFPQLRKIIADYGMLLDEGEIKNGVMMVYLDSKDREFFKHKLSKTFKNNYSDITEREIVATYNELIELTVVRRKYDLSLDEVLKLYKMLAIMSSEFINIHAVPEYGEIKVSIVAVDKMFTDMISKFMKKAQKREDRRIFLTSATICSYDYHGLFAPKTVIKNVLFGHGGDPMQTNKKMLILADTKKFSSVGKNSFYKRSTETLYKIIKILETYGDEDCVIITLSIREAKILEDGLKNCKHPHAVTYYKAPSMMGVSSSCRVMIAVGAAEKPANAFDAYRETKEESDALRDEATHSDTWQAWSRVKDPGGKETSLVFALGCNEKQCRAATAWGFGRKITDNYTVEDIGLEFTEKNITSPEIKRCRDFEEMMKEALTFKQGKYIFEDFSQIFPIYYIIGKNNIISSKIYNRCNLLQLLIAREDAYALQNSDGSYYKENGKVDENLLRRHLSGEITVGAYTLGPGNMVKWVCFDIDAHRKPEDSDSQYNLKCQQSDENVNKIGNLLKSLSIPFILEWSGSPFSYHIWILLKPVAAKQAKLFGRYIIKTAKVKCEVYPKQMIADKKGYGNLVKLIFATHRKTGNKSAILINGEWCEDFTELEIGIVDISGIEFKEPAAEAREAVDMPEEMKVRAGKVRPFFEWALTQQLEGEEGHNLRIYCVREYYNAGMKDPAALTELFKGQKDYNFNESLYHVESIINIELPSVRTSTLIENCEGFYKAWLNRHE